MLLVDLCGVRRCTVQHAHLLVGIASVVGWELHAAVDVVQRAARHLERFVTDRGDTAQVGLIALILEDGFLAQLNPILFFQFADHRLQILELLLLGSDHCLNLHVDLLLHAALVHTVASDASEKFHSLVEAALDTTLVKVHKELFRLLFLDHFADQLLGLDPDLFLLLLESPLVDPAQDVKLISLNLICLLLNVGDLLLIHIVFLEELRSLLLLQFLNTGVQNFKIAVLQLEDLV